MVRKPGPALALAALLAAPAFFACQASFQAGSGANQAPAPPPPPPPAVTAAPAPTAQPAPQTSGTGGDGADTAAPSSDQGTGGGTSSSADEVKVKRGQVEVPGNIVFETGKASLQPDSGSEAVLQQLKDFLDKNPKITQVRIEGHTDNVGDPDANLELSGQRSLTVKKWLVAKGIAATRLLAVGFGEQRPVADNATEEGRAQNRRTEFHVAEMYGKKYLGKNPTGGGKVFEE